jgi:hypothetical protein
VTRLRLAEPPPPIELEASEAEWRERWLHRWAFFHGHYFDTKQLPLPEMEEFLDRRGLRRDAEGFLGRLQAARRSWSRHNSTP